MFTLDACEKMAIVCCLLSECNMSLKLLPNISWLFTDEKEVARVSCMEEKWKKLDAVLYVQSEKNQKEASEREKKDLWEFE